MIPSSLEPSHGEPGRALRWPNREGFPSIATDLCAKCQVSSIAHRHFFELDRPDQVCQRSEYYELAAAVMLLGGASLA